MQQTKNRSSQHKGQVGVSSRSKLLRGAGLFLFMALVICFESAGQGQFRGDLRTVSNAGTTTSIKTKDFSPEQAFATPDLSKFENCTTTWVPPPPKSEWNTKPLWLPSVGVSGSADHSGRGDLLKPIINAVTGLHAGNKAYINSKRGLRHCHGQDETAACSVGGGINPEKQTKSFHEAVIYVIRNYRDAFPADYFDKDIKYRGKTEQTDEEVWRMVRDTWFDNSSVQNWIWGPLWWIQAEYYHIGMYVQYEKLLNVETGPLVVERLAQQFEAAGFNRAPQQDIPCIWYHAVKDEWTRQRNFYKYMPGYTPSQIQMFLANLKQGMRDAAASNDTELETIFKDYFSDTELLTRVDRPWTNTSAINGS
jgi:hypothetical protein